MTNENLFKEIEEDLERERYEELWKRYGSLIIVLALAIVAGTIGINYWQTHQAEIHQNATGELDTILAQNKADPSKQIQALESFAGRNTGQTQATFAELDAAATAVKLNKNDDAIKIYDAVASNAKADHAFRQLADLFSVQLQMDTGDAAVLQKRLQPLMADNEPWRFSAMEASAFIAYHSGDMATAKKLFTDLSQDASVPKSMSMRAADMLKVFKE